MAQGCWGLRHGAAKTDCSVREGEPGAESAGSSGGDLAHPGSVPQHLSWARKAGASNGVPYCPRQGKAITQIRGP